MVITKIELQRILDNMPDKIQVEKVFDKILLAANIEKTYNEQELYQNDDWEDFKTAWAREEFNQ